MATTYYTTATLVKDRFKFISSKLTDEKIQDQIEAVESMIDTLLGESFKDSFDATKHGILREAATLWVTINLIDYDRTEAFDQGVDVQSVINTLWMKLDSILRILPLEGTKNILKQT
jgi:hypothetical protein